MSLACRPVKLVVVIAFAVIGLISPLAFAQEVEGVRRIRVPHREHGYGNFKSQVITTQEEFDNFVKTVEKQGGWNRRPALLEALKNNEPT